MEENKYIINSHTHLFLDTDVPENFLPLKLVPVLRTKVGYFLLSRLLTNLNPFDSKDAFNRMVNFIKAGKLGSQKNLFLEMLKYYPSNTRFVVLPMQMETMGAGKTKRPYFDQIKELAALYKEYPDNIIPFVAIDCRDKNMDIIFDFAMNNGFKGVKFYPPLGTFLYDDRYDDILSECEKYSIPVTVHGTGGNPVHWKGSDAELKELLSKSKDPIDFKGKNRKELCAEFTKPSNYKYVYDKFPKLKINIAHLGGANQLDKFMENGSDSDNWFNQIMDMCRTYESLYTDVSFTLYNPDYIPIVSIMMEDEKIKNKILFGSDYYMDLSEKNERWFSTDLRYAIGKENWILMSYENPKRFLNI